MALPFNIFSIGKEPKSYLGVDIGTLSIKIVELSSENGRPKLQNYAILSNYNLIENKTPKVFGGEASMMLRRMLKESGIVAKEINMSAPIFSSFLTIMELPPMSESEVASAIQFEAKKYIPVPLDSVLIDWSLIGTSAEGPSTTFGAGLPAGQAGKILILLIAIPKDLVNEYQFIARESDLKLNNLELETTSATRALIGNDPVPAVLMDMGSRDTTISVVDGGYLRISHSIEASGEDLTRALANSLNISWRRAEELKKEQGLKVMDNNNQINDVLAPLLDTIVNAAKNIIDLYFSKTNKKVEKLIIYGGAAKMPGFSQYLGKGLGIDALIGNPFSKIIYDEKLNPIMEEIGHEFTIATGLALKAIQ
ncbi:MAG: type IV pilus assembly protein PilM [Parcubacteria group bacterium]|nr:type IV pilus assembly protein PilM [Parcubacteria group bacterium]